MKRASLSSKVSSFFIVASIATIVFVYIVFFQLFQQHLIKVEEEKAKLIAQTIEPMIAVSYFLGLEDDVRQLAEKTYQHEQITGLEIVIENTVIWSKKPDPDSDHIKINYPVINHLNSEPEGNIFLSYSKDSLLETIRNVHVEILYYLGVLGIAFFMFVLMSRYFFRPFAQIAEKVQDYKPGTEIDFTNVRDEPEVLSIVNAFESMVSNIREYTVLLERYKYSIDESAVVVRMNLDGQISYVNDEFCRISGYGKNEPVGQSVFSICHLGEDKEQCENMLETARKKQVWKGNLQNQRKSGGVYYVSATVVPIFDENENIIELISIQQDITHVVEQQEKILKQTTDVITGLYNRIKLEEDIVSVKNPKIAILCLDNYNIIKSYYGWESGKQILKEVAEIILSLKNIKDASIYKLAGSEFAILSGGTLDMDLFHGICRTVLEKINNYSIQLESSSVHIRASAGLSSDKEHLLSYAGLALQHAQATRHLTVIYEETENLVQQFENNLKWTKKLSNALMDERIVVFVQPIFSSKNLEVEKYECLVRMIDDDGKTVISPFKFLEIAKESKQYHQITRRVIDITFEHFSKLPDVEFSINFTLDDMLHRPTIDLLKSKLMSSGLASRFVLEIVESEGIDSFSEIPLIFSELKSIGCKIAIDDFGTGYSNFAYLLRLNVDYIKIDGSLIKNIDTDINSKIITSTILEFAEQMDLLTVAEFVHKEEILEYVTKLGIDYVQGFYLGEPGPIELLSST